MMRFNFCREIGLFALAICLAASSEGMAQPVCGPVSMTQNFDPDLVIENLAFTCSISEGPNHETRYARTYDLSACSAAGNNFLVDCVTFAVQSNDTAPYTVFVNIYQDLDGGIPGSDGTDLELLGTVSVEIGLVTPGSQAFFTADFTTLVDPVEMPADSVMVVELLLPDRSSLGGDGGRMLPGCNNTGESTIADGPAVSYVAAPICLGGSSFTSVDSIGFPNAMLIQVIQGQLAEPIPACLADCADANGNVNVTDLLALLAEWGLPAQACDIAGGDDNVNVTDLLALLAGWGSCPVRPDFCIGDTDNSGGVNVTDLLALLAAWGLESCTTADLDFDGTINVTDLLLLLAAWGSCPP